MLSKLKKYIKKKIQNFLGMNQLFEKLDKIKFELGKLELEHHLNHSNNIDKINVSVFSQNEEDGIIQYIIKKIDNELNKIKENKEIKINKLLKKLLSVKLIIMVKNTIKINGNSLPSLNTEKVGNSYVK